jgi:hypothetical protein
VNIPHRNADPDQCLPDGSGVDSEVTADIGEGHARQVLAPSIVDLVRSKPWVPTGDLVPPHVIEHGLASDPEPLGQNLHLDLGEVPGGEPLEFFGPEPALTLSRRRLCVRF